MSPTIVSKTGSAQGLSKPHLCLQDGLSQSSCTPPRCSSSTPSSTPSGTQPEHVPDFEPEHDADLGDVAYDAYIMEEETLYALDYSEDVVVDDVALGPGSSSVDASASGAVLSVSTATAVAVDDSDSEMCLSLLWRPGHMPATLA